MASAARPILRGMALFLFGVVFGGMVGFAIAVLWLDKPRNPDPLVLAGMLDHMNRERRGGRTAVANAHHK